MRMLTHIYTCTHSTYAIAVDSRQSVRETAPYTRTYDTEIQLSHVFKELRLHIHISLRFEAVKTMYLNLNQRNMLQLFLKFYL